MGCFLNFSFLLHLYKMFFCNSKTKSMKQGTFPSLSQVPYSSFLSRGNHWTFHFWFILILKKYIMYYSGFTLIFTPVFTSMSLPSSHTYTAIKSYGIIWSCSLRVCGYVYMCIYIYLSVYIPLSRGIYIERGILDRILATCDNFAGKQIENCIYKGKLKFSLFSSNSNFNFFHNAWYFIFLNIFFIIV